MVDRRAQDTRMRRRILSLVFRETRKAAGVFPRAFMIVWHAAPLVAVKVLGAKVVDGLGPVATVWVTKRVIDAIVHAASAEPGQAHPQAAIVWIGALAAVWLGAKAVAAVGTVLEVRLEGAVEQHADTLIMHKCTTMDVAFFENPKYQDMLRNATQGTHAVGEVIARVVFSLLQHSVVVAGMLVIILTNLHWVVVGVALVTILPSAAVNSVFVRRQWATVTSRAEDYRFQSYFRDLVRQRGPAKEIRLFGLADALIARFRQGHMAIWARYLKLETNKQVALLASGALSTGGLAFCWIYIALRAVAGNISVGDVVMLTQAVTAAQGGLTNLLGLGGTYYERALSLRNFFGLLDLEPGRVAGALVGPSGNGPIRWGAIGAPTRPEAGIEFRDVSFKYPDTEEWAVRRASFHLRPGMSAAIVGRNGAGKTTLVKLLVRLYDPTEGEILYEGRNLKEYDLASLYRCFGVIFQDYVQYGLTVRENIGFGQVERMEDLEAVAEAAAKAGVAPVIEKLPSGYETYLGRMFGETSTDLSGGEWQRIALARAYMRNSPVLILDEPTASMDVFGEAEIYQAFAEMMRDHIAVVISHRFATVRNVEHVLVLDKGMVVEQGTHTELMAQKGLYAEMYQLQARNYQQRR